MHHNSLIVATAEWVPERCERDPRNFSRVIGLSFQGPRGDAPSRCGAGESSLRCRGCQTLSSFFLNREFRGRDRSQRKIEALPPKGWCCLFVLRDLPFPAPRHLPLRVVAGASSQETQKLRRLSGLWLDCLVCKLGDWLWTTNPLAYKTKPNSILVRTPSGAAAVAGGVPFEAGGYMLQAQPLGKSFSARCPQKAILMKILLI